MLYHDIVLCIVLSERLVHFANNDERFIIKNGRETFNI